MKNKIDELIIEEINITLISIDPLLALTLIAGLFLLIKHKTAIRWIGHAAKFLIEAYVESKVKDKDDNP